MQDNKAIFEMLFNRNFSDAGNESFLRELTEKHPYFAPAQFFLLQKTSADSSEFEKRAVKANILFNNPYWLNFQLNRINTAATLHPVPQEKETIAEEESKPVEMGPIPVADLPDDTDAPEQPAIEEEIAPMKIELKMPELKSNMDESMLFEPMHLVDYFASQGIKLPEEVQSADKLGKQLKSFTEWLKIMKKVPVPGAVEPALETDDKIQSLAENSNAEAEVWTESMAEVYARQGKPAKAVEVYQKLSLLNPAKSTYFAAKIENLKGS
ncbi:MAG TPA: hypothetical protein VHL77_13005 [Ferruginibacter sp.]|jgi:hypothetical protein|nr:hypothetical protein [Ferruginibacter sp.]